MTQRTGIVAALIAVVLTASASAQDWRGRARLTGVVTDPNGKAIAGARVRLTTMRGSGGPELATTDKNGRWVAGGLSGGGWNIDIEADGFEKKAGTVEVSETRSAPAMKTVLTPAPQNTASETSAATISVGGVAISPETAEALEAANRFMKEQQWANAAAEYEKALVALPGNASVKSALSRAYHGAGQIKKAIPPLMDVSRADPGNVTVAMLLANMLAEDGQLDEAKKVLDAMPPGAVVDPTAILNIGILFMNKGQAEDAFSYFDKAVKIAPATPETYYYRALSELQLKKSDAARADLRKVIELAPDSDEAKDAKELLDELQ